jgi:phage shock protein C
MPEQVKQLYRSRDNRMIGGVCGGLGDYLGIDPTIVRLIFIIAVVASWIAPAALIYIIMLVVVPEAPSPVTGSEQIGRTGQPETEAPAGEDEIAPPEAPGE